MFTAGAFCGAAFAGPTGDKLGRRWTITIGCIIFCLGGGLQTGAQTIAYLYSGRFFAGLGYVYTASIQVKSGAIVEHLLILSWSAESVSLP